MARRWLLCCGGLLALASLWPMVGALRALDRRDYLSAVLHVVLVVVLARTGLDLVAPDDGATGPDR